MYGLESNANQPDPVYELESDAADREFISTQLHSMYANVTSYKLVPANETVATA